MSVVSKPLHWITHLVGELAPFSRAGARRWRRGVYFGLGLLGLFWLAEILLLPVLVRYQLKNILAKLGFPNATFVVSSVTTDRATLYDVRGNGVDEPTIDSAIIRFSPWNIIHGQLGEIDLIGATIIFDPKEGADNLGHRHHKTLAERLKPDPIDDFCFDRIVLQSSTLIIRTADHKYSIPASGTLTRLGFDLCAINTQMQFNGAEFDILGKFDTDKHINDIQLKADAIGLDWLIDLAQSRLDLPVRGGGIAALKAEFHDDLNSHHLHISFDPHDAWVDAHIDKQTMSFDRADCHMETDFGDSWEVERFLASATIPHASLGGKRIRDIKLSALPVDQRTYALRASASASLTDLLPAAVALHQIDLTNLADAEVVGESTLKIGAPDSHDPPWRLDHVKIDTTLPPGEASLPAWGVKLNGLSANIPFEGSVTPDVIQMAFLPNGGIRVATVEMDGCKIVPLKSGAPMVAVTFAYDSAMSVKTVAFLESWSGNVGINVAAQPADVSVAGANFAGLEGGLSLAIKADPTRATTSILPGSLLKWSGVKSTGATVSGGQIVFGGELIKPVGQPLIVDTALHLDKTSMHLESAGVDFADIQANIPLRWNATTAMSPDASQFSIASVTVPSTKLPGINGTIAVEDGKLGFNIIWPIVSGAVVHGTAQFGMASTGAAGDIKLEIPEFQISDPKVLTNIFPASHGMSITGDFSASAEFKIEAGKFIPHAMISGHTIHVESVAYDAVLDDVNSKIELSSFAPLATPGDQSIYVGTAKFGKLALANGEIHYRIEDPHSIMVEKTIWDFAGGKLRAESFRVDPTRPVLDLEADAEDLTVGGMFDTFLPGEASGTGILYGKIPIRLRWPRVFFGKGFLYAKPGPGEFKLVGAAAKVGELLDASDPRFKTDFNFKQIKSRALSAIADFQYDLLKVDWENTEDGNVGAIHLSGKGKGDDGQGLNLNINFSGLDKGVTRYLIIEKDKGQ